MYDELIKRLSGLCQYENCVLCKEAADAIEDLEFACNRYEKDYKALCAYLPKWIPVSERLPEDSGYYIVCAKDGSRTHVSFVKYQYRYKSWLLNGARAYWIITHWMPLPEPPKEVPGHE